MKKCVAVFRSRTQVMAFIEHMRNKGQSVKPVPTPKEAKIGCGISCEIPQNSVNLARQVISYYSLNAFYGFFIIEKVQNRISTRKI